MKRLEPSAIVAAPAERLRCAQGIRALAHLVRWCSAASRRTPLVPFEMLGNRCCVVADRAMPGAASSEVLAWASVRIDAHRIGAPAALTGCSRGMCWQVVREFGVPLKLLVTFRQAAALSARGYPAWAIADAAGVDWLDACRHRAA